MEKQQGNGLIYGLNDKPPFKEAFFAALQHLLAIFVAIITPPLIIAGALKLDAETTGYLVSMALFASGISTFIQCRRFGGLGTGLLCIQGTSFSFIGPIISAGMLGGLPLIFGSCMAASSVEMLISRVLKYTKKIITPLISGIVVTLIGMSLIKVGITACGGGATAQADGSFGSFRHVGLAAAVLLLIIAFNRSSNRYLRMSSIVIGLVIGYIAAWFMGIIDFSSIQSYSGFNLPMMATANISPNNVKVLIEKPNNDMIANVPISETGIVIQGMMTARQFCRKRKITSTTNSVVSKKVTITSSMDAWITSVVSSVTLYCTPAGKFCDNSCIFALTPVDTSSELLPGCW